MSIIGNAFDHATFMPGRRRLILIRVQIIGPSIKADKKGVRMATEYRMIEWFLIYGTLAKEGHSLQNYAE